MTGRLTPVELKRRLAAGEDLDGVVVKTPSHQVIEVLAAGGTALVMIDTEHGQIGIETLDAMVAVASALGVAALVRVPAADRVAIQQTLDTGATGVVVPHVHSAALAADVVRWSHYGDGGRGFTGSTRSAGWGTRPIGEVVAAAAAETVVIVQIEDVAAADAADAIAGTDGVDAVFVGAADLAVATGSTSTSDPGVVEACDRIIAKVLAAGTAAVAYAATDAEAARWRAAGVTVVLTGSDQTRLR